MVSVQYNHTKLLNVANPILTCQHANCFGFLGGNVNMLNIQFKIVTFNDIQNTYCVLCFCIVRITR
jgi:hypothetical protein